MRIHVFGWCVVATGEKRELHLLFMWLLSLDISASVVVGEQILRDRVWRVQQPHFAAGTLVLLALALHGQHGSGSRLSNLIHFSLF